MKLRTSLCNPTALRKDITRFAPVWVLYTVGLFMMLTVVMLDGSEFYQTSGMVGSLSFMGSVNLCYGLLNAQLLFGDLFSARHCNALHAMPLRRECWFVTHVISGLLFAFVPNLLMSVIAMTLLGAGRVVAAWWLLAAMLQYLFFFGLAVCSALCVGNRFAMVLVYAIVNFFSLLVYWFYYAIYEPLLYGVFMEPNAFTRFCPVWVMIENYELVNVIPNDGGDYWNRTVHSVVMGEGWGYLAICAALGVALLGIALMLYRRRQLESAGDFMAVRALEPVFLVLYTLSMAAGFQVFTELFGGNEYIFLGLGLIVGFFTGRMLLMRTTRVFQVKGFLWFAVLTVAFAGTMVLTWLDPIGFTRRIPTADQIQSVQMSDYYTPSNSNAPVLTEAGDIETVRQIHQLVLDGQIEELDGKPEEEIYYENLSIHYVLNNGTTVSRKYSVATGSPAGQRAEEFYTRPEYVLGSDDVDFLMENMTYAYYSDQRKEINGQINHLDPEMNAMLRDLMEAIIADCREGTMAQSYGYHVDEEQLGWIEFGFDNESSLISFCQITVYECNRHTVAYLEENEIVVGRYG